MRPRDLCGTILERETPDILQRLQAEVPPGTPVSVTGTGRFVARAQRFWLALLPAYPIASNAELRICPIPCAEPGDEELERGGEFVLLRRRGAR